MSQVSRGCDGKNGQGTCSLRTVLCWGRWEWGCPRGNLTVRWSWQLGGRVCKMLRIWWLWERPRVTMMKINPGGKENVIKGHSNTLDVRREERV